LPAGARAENIPEASRLTWKQAVMKLRSNLASEEESKK